MCARYMFFRLPSQKSEGSCICVPGICFSDCQARRVRGHVYVCQVYVFQIVKPEESGVMYMCARYIVFQAFGTVLTVWYFFNFIIIFSLLRSSYGDAKSRKSR